MKKKTAHCMAIVICIFLSYHSFSQENHYKEPAWVSDKGYWVVETNLHQPRQNTIRFYNNENELIDTKLIDGRKLRLKKSKVKFQLKTMLETSVLAWAAKKVAADNAALVKQP